jgi:hypothetical protein
MLNKMLSRNAFRSESAAGVSSAVAPAPVSSSSAKSAELNSWSALMISEAALEEMNEGGGLTDGGDIKLTLEYCDSLETTEGLRLREEDLAAASRKSGVLKDIVEVKLIVMRPAASFCFVFPEGAG